MSQSHSKKLFFLLFLFLSAQTVFACSCSRNYFCEYINENPNNMVAFRATVTDAVEYSSWNRAVFFEVTETYRTDIEIGTEIKLYGGGDNQEVGCQTNVYSRFEVGEDVFLAIGLDWYGSELGFPFSGSATDPFFGWEFSPHLCHFTKLRVVDQNVLGFISEDLYEYPLADFLESLENCDYGISNIEETTPNLKLSIYPNPSDTGIIRIETEDCIDAETAVTVYNTAGKVITHRKLNVADSGSFRVENLTAGAYFVQITCGTKSRTERVVIL